MIFIANKIYSIEGNSNYANFDNGFLNRGGRCVGGYDLQKVGENKGKYAVLVDKPYDGESDCLLVGYADTLPEAVAMLWVAKEWAQ